MKVECKYDRMVDIDLLVPNHLNANKHPERQIKLLAKIMKQQGWRSPVVISKRSGFVVAGHGRIEAARLNGWTEVPVDDQDFESEAIEYAHLIADNKISALAEHDDSMMIDELMNNEALKDLDFELLGMLDFELPTDIDEAKEEIEDDVPSDVETRVKPGDLWKLGDHVLLCGDATNIQHVERLMGGEKADMVFTDPPYNIGYRDMSKQFGEIKNDKMSEPDFSDFLLSSIPKAPIMYICCSWKFCNIFKKSMDDIECSPKSMIIWNKVNPARHLDKYFKQHEILFYYGPFGGQKTLRGDIWELKRQKNTLHPTMKPIELIEMALFDHNVKNILDVFGGSGSTLIACEKTKRKCFMMEIDPHYCSVILERWEKYSDKKAELIGNE